MTGWRTLALDEACHIEYGTRVVRKRDGGTKFPVYGGGGETFAMDTANREDRVVIARFGMSPLCTRFVAGKFFLNDSGLTLAPKNGNLDQRFMNYWAFAHNDAIHALGKGSAQKNLAVDDFRQMPVRFPAPAEQRRIVGILDEAFAAIATAEANAEKNLQNARNVFEVHVSRLLGHGGDDWQNTSIGDQMTFQRGFDITKEQQQPGNVPVVSSGGVKSFHNTAMAKAPGVVIGRKGTLGKVFFLESDYWPHDTTLWVRDFKGNDARFVYHFMRNLDVAHLDTGTANPALNRNLLHPIPVRWPPVGAQASLAAKLDGLEANSSSLGEEYERKLVMLDELRQSLLHHAFTGSPMTGITNRVRR